MNTTHDVYWDELGIAWRAITPDPARVGQRLQQRLRWQARCVSCIVVTGFPLGVAGLVLGTFTAWNGWHTGIWHFITRGIAIIAIAVLACFAAWTLRGGARALTGTLSEMIGMAILRAQQARAATAFAYCAIAVVASFGVVGYGIRAQFGRPASMAPIEPLLALALCWSVVHLYRRRLTDELVKLQCLNEALGSDV